MFKQIRTMILVVGFSFPGMLRSTLFAAIVLALPDLASAAVITYTDRSVFDAAIISNGYVSQTLDFDSETAGTLIPSTTSVSGITFNYNFGSAQLLISDQYNTTSGTNFLGTDDGSDLLQDGDDFSLSFSARTAIGLYVISIDSLVDGDFTLTVGATTASLNTANLQQTLPDTSKVYFLGLIDDSSSFTSALLETHGGGGAFTYNVDDIITASSAAVPEPASVFLMASVAFGFGVRKWRRSRQESAKDHRSATV